MSMNGGSVQLLLSHVLWRGLTLCPPRALRLHSPTDVLGQGIGHEPSRPLHHRFWSATHKPLVADRRGDAGEMEILILSTCFID